MTLSLSLEFLLTSFCHSPCVFVLSLYFYLSLSPFSTIRSNAVCWTSHATASAHKATVCGDCTRFGGGRRSIPQEATNCASLISYCRRIFHICSLNLKELHFNHNIDVPGEIPKKSFTAQTAKKCLFWKKRYSSRSFPRCGRVRAIRRWDGHNELLGLSVYAQGGLEPESF